jgi:hypothetical protein
MDLNKIKQAIINIIVNLIISKVITKENLEKWITEALDKAVENAKKSPAEWDDPIVQKIHDVVMEMIGK